MELSSENSQWLNYFRKKNLIVDVWLGSKYASASNVFNIVINERNKLDFNIRSSDKYFWS